jgi:hypothetical protein
MLKGVEISVSRFLGHGLIGGFLSALLFEDAIGRCAYYGAEECGVAASLASHRRGAGRTDS